MAKDGKRSRVRRLALLFASVLAAVGAGLAIQGWRVTVRFVGSDAADPDPSRPRASVIRRADEASVFLRLQPIGRYGLEDIGAGSLAGPGSIPVTEIRPPIPQAVPRSFSGLHLSFPREWPQVSYEIGTHPHQPVRLPPDPIRLICDACSAVNWALHRPGDTSPMGEMLLVDAASFGVITLMGNGRVTLMEWDP